MSHRILHSETRAKFEKWRAALPPGNFAAAWPVLARSTREERAAHFDHRAGLRGAFGRDLPHRPGFRVVSKLDRRLRPDFWSVSDKRQTVSR